MNTYNKILASSLLAAGALLAYNPVNTTIVAAQPVSVAPVAAEEVLAGEGTLAFDKVAVVTTKAPKSTGKEDPAGWVRGIAAEAGLSFRGARIEVTSNGNCGEGCTFATVKDGVVINPTVVKIQPRNIGTEYGKFVVLHELGHVNGIVSECGADQFARNHGGSPAFKDAHC